MHFQIATYAYLKLMHKYDIICKSNFLISNLLQMFIHFYFLSHTLPQISQEPNTDSMVLSHAFGAIGPKCNHKVKFLL